AKCLPSPPRGPWGAAYGPSLLPPTPPLCDHCGDPLATWREEPFDLRCTRCRRRPPIVDRARAVGTYEGALREIVHALKYDGRRSLAEPLARLMRQRGAAILEGGSAVV